MSFINDNWLSNTINAFAQSNKIFMSEAQFQFHLAWEIQKEIERQNICGKVELEKFTMQVDNNKKYTDIYVSFDDEDIAIELKYKTRSFSFSNNNYTYNLANHGAVDLGRFDYLWDIYRLEMLKYSTSFQSKESNLRQIAIKCGNSSITSQVQTKYYIDVKKKIRGFAIILTNEPKYWAYTNKQNCPNTYKFCSNVLYKEFCISDLDKFEKGKMYNWLLNNNQYTKAICGTWRGRPLEFENDYKFLWQNYPQISTLQGKEEFKYIITEV